MFRLTQILLERAVARGIGWTGCAFLGALAFADSSCFLIQEKRDTISLPAQFLKRDDALKIDGAYVADGDNPEMHARVLILYANGTAMNPGAVRTVETRALDDWLKTRRFGDRERHVPWMWGRYNVRNDSIFIEFLYPSTGTYRAIVRSGVIISDTTFAITALSYADGSGKQQACELYRFVPLPEKPDSTNNVLNGPY